MAAVIIALITAAIIDVAKTFRFLIGKIYLSTLLKVAKDTVDIF